MAYRSSVQLARKGIRTPNDQIRLMTALTCDVIQKQVTPYVVNAACNATGKTLKTAELILKHGRKFTAVLRQATK